MPLTSLAISPLMRRAILAALGFTILFCASVATQSDANAGILDGSYRDREAQALMRVVLAKENTPDRCRYETSWSSSATLSETLAKLEFGTTVDAKLSPPDNTRPLLDIIDPSHSTDNAIYCDEAERKRYLISAEDDVIRGRTDIIHVDWRSLSYPIFNRDFKKAVVIITRYSIDGAREGDQIVYQPLRAIAVAEVYRKIKGTWSYVRYHDLNTH